ncbi:ABC transporter ATP-binding protein [Rhodomicrobium lacus]|uniref:branched-chain amino acid ABC transporter ATP-binding protein n=1 Tax=Rhodomicrobium lacus TaxID=2498452 RepID=UPI000F8F4106|nr:ABC transporter ATP-binding protein [Rhodomicrobium lacus]
MRLKVSKLVTGYNRDPILNGVSFDLEAGTLLAVLGHNGAGKSSLVRSLVGLLPAWEGTIEIEGHDVTTRPSKERIRAGLAVSFQDDPVFPTLPVKTNLRLGGYAHWRDRKRIERRTEEVLTLFPKLRVHYLRPAYTMSGGERRMLSIAMALMSEPTVLLLDEPSTGLSPGMTAHVFESIESVSRSLGISVLLIEQNVEQALRHADRVLVLKTGKVVFDGAPENLASDATELVMMF